MISSPIKSRSETWQKLVNMAVLKAVMMFLLNDVMFYRKCFIKAYLIIFKFGTFQGLDRRRA